MKLTTTSKSNVLISHRIKCPRIEPVPEGIYRPFWSVMIPTYNNTSYLEQTLRSVLDQDPGLEEMQIEVVDNCSTQDDPEFLVKKIGVGRVSFYRQQNNVGATQNFNTCIERSVGQVLHILHSDDFVLPGFYIYLREAFEKEPTIGAAFCRHIYIDEKGHWRKLSPLERSTPGVVTSFLERIAVTQLIQAPSIVVKRCTYEQLGGFHLELIHASDWEMWKRITAHYRVWYEPQPLACYRLHSSSNTSCLVRSGSDIRDIRRSIEISQTYLPDTIAREISGKAREYYGLYAINAAHRMFVIHDIAPGITQVREALKCSHSLRVVWSLVGLFVWAGIRFIRGMVRTMVRTGMEITYQKVAKSCRFR